MSFHSIYLRHFYGISLLFISGLALADTIRIAVASNFANTISTLATVFEDSNNSSLQISLGSSGKIYTQILHGAPYDIFLSADQKSPQSLVAQGLAQENSLTTYAVGQLALWASDPRLLQNTDPSTLLKQANYTLALANPRLAPYGIASIETLSSLGITKNKASKRVYGENIAQTYQFIASGNADLGFIAATQKPNYGSYWPVPSTLHAPIRQDAVLLTRAKNNTAAQAFMAFLSSHEARAIIRTHHYQVEKRNDF